MTGEFLEDNIGKIVKIKEKSENIFVDEYVIVPDSISGIGKVVFVNLFPADKGFSKVNAGISVDGVLRYNIGYISDDPFSSIKILSGNINFEGFIRGDDFDCEDKYVNTGITLEKVDYSVINSKKISLNVALNLNCIFCEWQYEKYLIDANCGDNAQLLTNKFLASTLVDIKQQDFEVEETIQIPFEKDEIQDIAFSNISSYTSSFEEGTDGLTLKLDISAKIGYISTQGELIVEDIQFQKEKIINLDNIPQGLKYIVTSQLKDIEVQGVDDDDGELRVLELRSKFESFIEVYEEIDFQYVQDAYFTDANEKIESQELEILVNMHNYKKTLQLSSLYEGVGNFKDVYITNSNIDFNHSVNEKDILLNGTLNMRGILIPDSEDDSPKGIQIELPFEETIQTDYDFDCTTDDIRLSLITEDVFASCADEEKVEFNASLALEITILERKKILCAQDIEKIDTLDKEDESSSTIKLYYTKENEFLWDICKKYKINKADITNVNEEIDFDNLAKGTMLLIP